MSTAAVIAEYNPFHNGHLHMLNRARELTGASRVLVVMSGCFTQRGTPAVADPHIRAAMALRNGADAVFELPVCYSTQSAEYFAMGAVSLLEQLHTADYLCFGSESGDLLKLTSLSDFLAGPPAGFDESLRRRMKEGFSYPAARAAAVEECLADKAFAATTHGSSPICQKPGILLSSPNNILAVEYLKALKRLGSSMRPVTIPREGAGYHDLGLKTENASASAVRNALEQGLNRRSTALLRSQVPGDVFASLVHLAPVTADDFSALLHYKLLLERGRGYARFDGVSGDLSDRIAGRLDEFVSFTQFAKLLKTRELTHTRILRGLLHILLDIQKEQTAFFTGLRLSSGAQRARDSFIAPFPAYLRLLGFRKSSKDLLSSVKQNSSLPLIGKLADAGKILPPLPLSMLEADIRSAHIYDSVAAKKTGRPISNEYRRPILVV